MNCPNVKECPCPTKTCPNYGKCCTCVTKHREKGDLPICLRGNGTDGKN
ncbi:MAG: hypothetical protein LBH03_05605 [Holophagales bacterium]|nr:hypothetical protein [Holophagales bacterium]